MNAYSLGTIVSAFGRHYEVRTQTGEVLHGTPRAKKSELACGDTVQWVLSAPGQCRIETFIERRNLLYRSDAFKQKLIAANLDVMMIVTAVEPSFSEALVSRCLSAAIAANIAPFIVLNKIDLSANLAQARKQLDIFHALNIPIIELCAYETSEKLRPHLFGKRAIFVGQSGMGKSTLTNALVPHAKATIGEISTALDAGRHTTTFARLYTLPENTELIDSPGLQMFGLAHLSELELAHSFPELRPLMGTCRFRNCHHDQEPGCAFITAVNAGLIHPKRFEHFCTIRAEIQNAKRQNPGW